MTLSDRLNAAQIRADRLSVKPHSEAYRKALYRLQDAIHAKMHEEVRNG